MRIACVVHFTVQIDLLEKPREIFAIEEPLKHNFSLAWACNSKVQLDNILFHSTQKWYKYFFHKNLQKKIQKVNVETKKKVKGFSV